ncbi:MAG: SDR family oxidoreductase [Alphaproteobacteria bacterium]|nr:SDR family oxidoreductase [Alphaproteobacteria bacterium]MBL6933403.1 SDR family oxidoreductase [Rhodospirillales bacterium]
MTKTVLVTGGLGYLGGRIALHLSEQGHDPEFELRLTTRRNSEAVPPWAAGMEVAGADFAAEKDFSALCLGVDTVVHLAALNAAQCANDPELAVRVNVTGTENLFDAAARAGVGRFIYVSTAHVYGAPLEGVLDENTPPRPAHVYAETHLAAEDIVLGGNGPMGIVLRLSNAVGVPADKEADCWLLAANDLCRRAATGNDLVLRGDGLDVRDFVALKDVCRAIEHFQSLDGDAVADRVFNIGGGSMTILDMAERIAGRTAAMFGSRPNIRRKEADSGEKALRLDYRIDRLLGTGFTPGGNLDDEIDATLKFCRQTF